jgi:hypothetical protein
MYLILHWIPVISWEVLIKYSQSHELVKIFMAWTRIKIVGYF